MAYTRKDYSGNAVTTTLSAGIGSGDTSITIVSATGWPTGSQGPFFAVIDPDLSGEEKILVTSRTGTTLTVSARGSDGTSASSHSSGATIKHVFTKTDADEANYAVSKTVGKITGAGTILIADGANSLAELDVKTSGRIIVGNGTTAASVAVSGDATLASSGALTVANDAVTYAKMQNVSATDRLLGRDTAGAGDVEELTLASSLSFTGSGGIRVASGGVGSTELAAGISRGALSSGYAEVTTSQTGITTLTDLTGLTVTVTVRAGSRIKITGYARIQKITTSDFCAVYIREGTTKLQAAASVPAIIEQEVMSPIVVLTPTTGSHTYKLSLESPTTGSADLLASTDAPAFILVEDIGA